MMLIIWNMENLKMIKIELDESEARVLLDAARDMARLWLNNMKTIENCYETKNIKIFNDERYKNAFFHASKLADIGAKIEDSLNKE